MKRFITVITAAAVLAVGGSFAYAATTAPPKVKVCVTKATATRTYAGKEDVRFAGDVRFYDGKCKPWETTEYISGYFTPTESPTTEVLTWTPTQGDDWAKRAFEKGTKLALEITDMSVSGGSGTCMFNLTAATPDDHDNDPVIRTFSANDFVGVNTVTLVEQSNLQVLSPSCPNATWSMTIKVTVTPSTIL